MRLKGLARVSRPGKFPRRVLAVRGPSTTWLLRLANAAPPLGGLRTTRSLRRVATVALKAARFSCAPAKRLWVMLEIEYAMPRPASARSAINSDRQRSRSQTLSRRAASGWRASPGARSAATESLPSISSTPSGCAGDWRNLKRTILSGLRAFVNGRWIRSRGSPRTIPAIR